MNLLRSVLSLFYPQCCPVCGSKLIEEEHCICLECLLKMPRTNYYFQPENSAADRFKGKVPYQKVAAFLYYNKGGWAQKVMVHFKYKGNSDLGCYMGELMSKEIQQSSFFSDIDWLIPIPLHSKKQKKRGFNQAEEMAKGIAKITGIPLSTDLVKREVKTETQTKKGRYERWLNTSGIFVARKDENYDDKHFLIVDDVLTTGATVEACAQAILQSCPNARISILTLAVTE